MARGMTEETGASGDIPQEGIKGGAQEGDALPLIEGKMNEIGQDMTEETGGHETSPTYRAQDERDGTEDVRGGLKAPGS
jgi:hypothetical protein